MSAQEATGRTNPRTNFLYVTTDDDGDVIAGASTTQDPGILQSSGASFISAWDGWMA